MNKKYLITAIIIIILAAIGYVAVTTLDNKPAAQQAEPQQTVQNETTETSIEAVPLVKDGVEHKDLKLSNARIVEADGKLSFVGTVKNTSKRLYAPVEVFVVFKDKDGKSVGSKSSTLALLEQGLSWDFEIPVPSNDAESFEARVLAPEEASTDWQMGN